VDPVWFGVMFLDLHASVGACCCRRHGLLLMTMKECVPRPQVTMGHIFRAVIPIHRHEPVVLALVFFVPAVAVWLPKVLV